MSVQASDSLVMQRYLLEFLKSRGEATYKTIASHLTRKRICTKWMVRRLLAELFATGQIRRVCRGRYVPGAQVSDASVPPPAPAAAPEPKSASSQKTMQMVVEALRQLGGEACITAIRARIKREFGHDLRGGTAFTKLNRLGMIERFGARGFYRLAGKAPTQGVLDVSTQLPLSSTGPVIAEVPSTSSPPVDDMAHAVVPGNDRVALLIEAYCARTEKRDQKRRELEKLQAQAEILEGDLDAIVGELSELTELINDMRRAESRSAKFLEPANPEPMPVEAASSIANGVGEPPAVGASADA